MSEAQKKNITTTVIGILGMINTIAIASGWYHLDNKTLGTVDQYVSYVVAFLGVVMSHRQPVKYYWTKFLSVFKKG